MKKCYDLINKSSVWRYCLILLISIVAIYPNYGQIQKKRALFVIDVQENLVNPNSRIHIDTSGINLFFSSLNYTISKFNDNGDEVIYIVIESTNPIENWITGNAYKKGGLGVELDKRLLIINDKIYTKSKPNSLTNKDLFKHLIEKNISEVYVAGLMAEGCVKATIKGLKSENFNVIAVENAIASKSRMKKNKAIEYFVKHDIKTIKVNEI